VLALLAVAVAVLAVPASAGTKGHARSRAALANLPVLPPQTDCASMAHADVSQATGAGVGITSAAPGTAQQGYPVCDIKGVIAPQIQFEIQLPTQTYQQRYLQLGCGGLCGTLALRVQGADGCVPVTNGAFVLASSNQGHVNGGSEDGNFGTDPQLRVDFAYRSDHVLAKASKALIERFYGKRPSYSYFDGCSQGGHQGLTEAQRFPHDFDGILAGAPASITQELNSFNQPWLARVDRDASGAVILPASKLPMLHDAVLKNCDAKDGLGDGQIDDPRACTFDPASLACSGNADAPDCLTSAQVAVVRKIYSGPVDSKGRHLYPGGQPYGAELAWSPWFIPPDPSAPQSSSIAWSIGNGWVKYLAFDPNPPLSFDVNDVQFTKREFRRSQKLAGLYNATDPDLSAFKRGGGKLIMWHGWADQAIPATGTVAYYRAVQDRMGGLAATKKFARLFMFPGVFHCGGGAAPNSFDLLTPLMEWVENGASPNQVVATQRATDGSVVRTRPVFAYPKVARYTGSGSIDDAANFKAASSGVHANDRFKWLGSFKPGRELWYDARTGRLYRKRHHH
jgi:feruloyl esterase